MINVQIITSDPKYIPSKSNDSDAGYDFKACILEDGSEEILHLLENALLARQECFFINGKKEDLIFEDSISTQKQALKIWNALAKKYSITKGRALAIASETSAAISSGIKIKMQTSRHMNNVLQMYSRSGLACNCGLTLVNHVGIIDQGYNDKEIIMKFKNDSLALHIITDGARVAQGIFTTALKADFVEVQEWETDEDRGGGFGSTGV